MRRALLAVALLLGLCSCARSGGSGPDQLVVAAVSHRTPTFGPWSQSTQADQMVASLLFSNLVKSTPDGRGVRPDLARSWRVSPDGLTYTFALRNGVRWSDGRPFTADDVVFTVTEAARFGATPYVGFQPLKWLEVKGAATIEGTTKPLAGVRALDRHTVAITLAQPDSTFLANISAGVYGIVPEHLLRGATAGTVTRTAFSTSRPVGTGPYTLVRYVPDQYLQFTARADYFDGKPKIRSLFFQPDALSSTGLTQLQAGNAQLLLKLAPDDNGYLKGVSGVRTTSIVSPGAEFLQFRVDSPRVADRRVRQAFYYAVDRRRMLARLFDHKGQIRWQMPGFDQSDPALDRYPYDPGKAKRLLRQAGFDFHRPFTLMYSPDLDPLWSRMAAVVQQNLQAIGVDLVLDPVDGAKWAALVTDPKPKYALTFQAGGSMGLGPDRSASYFQCKAPVNTFYSSCRLTKLYTKAQASTDPAERAAVYRAISRQLNTDVPYATLWQTDDLHAYSTRLGGGFRLYSDWRNSFTDIARWTLKG